VSIEQHFDRESSAGHMSVEILSIARLRPYPGNARTHSKKQIRQIADSIERFGFTNPVLQRIPVIWQHSLHVCNNGRIPAA
jgi:hypothetical protein